jgi:hypothetical protein
MTEKELTPEQIEHLYKIRDEYIARLGNIPYNKEGVEKSINWIYSLINLPAPRKVHCVSPLECQYVASMLQTLVSKKFI